MKLLSVVILILCVNFLRAGELYKAGVLQVQNKDVKAFTPYIYEAAKTGVDLLVLPPLESENGDSYDEAVKTVSSASKQAGLYVVLILNERTRCQMGYETVKSNLVFDRQGSIVAVSRKPLHGITNCTSTSSELVTFTTDFGVTFGVLMEEDLVLHDVQHMKGLKNFVVSSGWHAELPFLSASQLSSSWAYITNSNLVSSTGIYSGKAGVKTGSEKLTVVELDKNRGNGEPAVPSVKPTTMTSEKLSQYVIRTLDLGASSEGYKETVCHRSFCCEFFVKTQDSGAKSESSYGLAVFNGVHHYTANYNIGTQNCVVFGCSNGLCGARSKNNTNVFFEKISITANFTKNSAQLPIVQTTTVLPIEKFNFNTNSDGNSKQVTLELVDSQNVINFGIFARDFAKDFESNFGFDDKNSTKVSNDYIYEFIYNEDVQEFVDYIWIRLRVLIVVVSLYILEMM